ncbi:MAG TPA: DUF4422 domain-containing protein [Candidatus Ligilactobacillus excrementigallinarum]|uniref:DUF4422 domain-containing protein n=1 Tax=Candidatus Ligilactobacillus excrementigallinarum TaxID=2838641 RepID=A0A9D1UWB2_9LACO|nr:DUF4422 domain-containing protein [Candidatus Ligilactobacillus excrementigallinarum]
MKSEIYVVSHKKARMPEDKMYIPVQVGFNPENFEGYMRDNTGDNISDKNASYCELTAQYWGAKNRQADVKGLVHYRRLFTNGHSDFFKSVDAKWKDVLTHETLEKLMSKYDMVLPKKRNYYIETLWSHYEHSHHIEGLEVTREVINDLFPEYLPEFDKHMQEKKGHMFNILIAKSNLFDEYTDWLMKVLNEVENRIDISNYSKSEQRILGYISELLLDVWVEHNQINYTELPVMFMGNQHWVKKIANFLKRKVKGREE